MQTTITLENGQEIKIDNNLAWLMEYQNQFGEDILPTLMPLMLSFTDLLGFFIGQKFLGGILQSLTFCDHFHSHSIHLIF